MSLETDVNKSDWGDGSVITDLASEFPGSQVNQRSGGGVSGGLRYLRPRVFIASLCVCLLFPLNGLAQTPMRVLIQWATNPAQDWVETDCSAWATLSKKPIPAAGRGLRDDDLGDDGWIMAVMVMGTVIQSYDHYALEPAPEDGCKVTVWNDDTEDFSEPYGEVWTFLPAAQDSDIGGRYNTRNWAAVYSDSSDKRRDSMEFHPWSEFNVPSAGVTRHGVWVSDVLYLSHQETRQLHSWREWDAVEMMVLEPRAHTGHSVTRFLRDTLQASGVHVASDELAMNSVAGAGETSTESIAAGTDELAHMWTLNEEAGGTWENDATVIFEISTGDTNSSGGFLSVNGSAGHMACVNTGLTADTEVHTQAQAAFTLDAGIKTATFTGTWSTCNTTDKFEALLAAGCTAPHGNCALTWVYDSDSEVTVPYPAVAAVTPKRRMTVID